MTLHIHGWWWLLVEFIVGALILVAIVRAEMREAGDFYLPIVSFVTFWAWVTLMLGTVIGLLVA